MPSVGFQTSHDDPSPHWTERTLIFDDDENRLGHLAQSVLHGHWYLFMKHDLRNERPVSILFDNKEKERAMMFARGFFESKEHWQRESEGERHES